MTLVPALNFGIALTLSLLVVSACPKAMKVLYSIGAGFSLFVALINL